MTMAPEPLAQPISEKWAAAGATHEMFGIYHQPWNARMESHRVIGSVDGSGSFKFSTLIPDQQVYFEGEDYPAALALYESADFAELANLHRRAVGIITDPAASE